MSLLSLTPHILTQNQMYIYIAVTKCCKQLQILFSNYLTAYVAQYKTWLRLHMSVCTEESFTLEWQVATPTKAQSC